MKIKAFITLSESLLQAIDELNGAYKNRSDFLERAAWAYLEKLARDEGEAKDLAVINREADRLNEEALDVLSHQVIPSS